jgi:hypothetical protein
MLRVAETLLRPWLTEIPHQQRFLWRHQNGRFMDEKAITAHDPSIDQNGASALTLVEPVETSRLVTKSDSVKPKGASFRKWLGRALVVVGGIGVMISTLHLPEANDLIKTSAIWTAILMFSMIVMLAGVPGAYHGYMRPSHLKIIDLIWVLASGVAVYIALVQTAQYFPDLQRSNMAKALEKSKVQGHESAVRAYREECSAVATLSDTQCEDIRYIANMLVDGTWLSQDKVLELCPRPFNITSPPPGFGSNLIQTCMSSLNIVGINEDPIMKDKNNVEEWRFELTIWPIFMSLLVSLRIMKSIAEVFWLKPS